MDETSGEPEPPTQEHADDRTTQAGLPAIDIEALAEKVYRLMLAEIRLDRARGLATDDGG